MVTVQDVRDVLANLSSQRLPDATIEKQIRLATTIIENKKASDVDAQTLEDAKLVYSVYLTLAAYSSKFERRVGGAPPEIAGQLAFWERMKDRFIEFIQRGTFTLQALIAQPDTLHEQWQEGELTGEPY